MIKPEELTIWAMNDTPESGTEIIFDDGVGGDNRDGQHKRKL